MTSVMMSVMMYVMIIIVKLMKGFDILQIKKTARVKESEVNRSYSEIHKTPLRPSADSNQESKMLSRWGRSLQGRDVQSSWANLGQGILSAAVGQQHALIINSRNQCLGVGNNTYGQISGESETTSRLTPLNLLKDMKIMNVACGAYHSFVLNSKNELYAFGLNMKGQLGIGSFDSKTKPALVYMLLPGGAKNPKTNFYIETHEYKKRLRKSKQESELSNITNIITNYEMGSCLKPEREEEKKSINFHLQGDEAVVKVACGPLHSAVVTNKYRLFTCGYGEKYALGNGRNKTTCEFNQVRIKTNGRIDRLELGTTSIGYISAGRAFVAGTFADKTFEVFSPLSITDQVVDLKLTERSILVLTRKGEVLQMGEQSRDNDKSAWDLPRKVEKIPAIRQIFGGCNHFFALSESKLLYGWGDNTFNQITGLPDSKFIPSPKNLKLPICLSETLNIISGNGTTLLLSARPLDTETLQKEVRSFNEEGRSQLERHSEHQKSTAQKGVSNIGGSDEKQMLSDMGIQPRIFNCNVEIDFEELVFQSQISEGGYGIIYRGLWRETTVAIKMFKIESENAIKDFFSECAAMEALRHPNIVMFLGACTKSPNFAIVLEYCGNGSLWSTIQNVEFSLSWEDRRRFALDTARGVNYLHTCDPPVIHRDLKSLNLLLDESYRVKLADFGWTKGLDNYMTGKIGTYQWMAPEVIASQKYSQKADVFSYGVILWEIASREPPFKHLSGLQVSLEVLNNDLRPSIPKKTPEAFAKLMRRCWDRQASRRPSFKEIIKQLQTMKLA